MRKMVRVWNRLRDAVSWNSPEIVRDTLKIFDGSVLEDDGILISSAIESNDDETYLVLIEYFDNKELKHLDRESEEFKSLVNRMREIIEETIGSVELKRPMCDALGIEFVSPVRIFKFRE